MSCYSITNYVSISWNCNIDDEDFLFSRETVLDFKIIDIGCEKFLPYTPLSYVELI